MPVAVAPVRIFEVDHVDNRDLANIVQRQMIVANGGWITDARDGFFYSKPIGRVPNFLNYRARILPSRAKPFLIHAELRIGDHVEEDSCHISVRRRVVAVLASKPFATEKISVPSFIENELFCVEQYKVETVAIGQIAHMVA